MSAEALASYVVVAIGGIAIGTIQKYELGRVFLWLLVALIGAGLLGYFLGANQSVRDTVSLWVGLASFMLIPGGLLMAILALPQAGFERVFTRRRRGRE